MAGVLRAISDCTLAAREVTMHDYQKCWLILLLALATTPLLGCDDEDKPTVSKVETLETLGRVSFSSPALAVDVLGDFAYVAASQAGLVVVDLSVPEAPSIVDRIDTAKQATAIAVARTHDGDGTSRDIAFLVDSAEGIRTFDVSDPFSVVDFHQGSAAYLGTGLCVVQPEFVGDPYQVYLADSWRGVRVFLSVPEYPGVLECRTFVSTYGQAQTIAVAGNTGYVADDERGLTVIDVTDAATGSMQLLVNHETPGNAMDVDVMGSFILLADGRHGLQVIEITGDWQATTVAALPLDGTCVAIRIRETRAYIAARDGGLHTVDLHDPYHPRHLGSNPSPDAVGVALSSGDLVCVADAEEGLLVLRDDSAPSDTTAPASVQDLEARLEDSTSVTLTWTAPGDDGTVGRAAVYDLRSSAEEITDDNWTDATPVLPLPLPGASGRLESMAIQDLPPGSTHYFGLIACDDESNCSGLSNTARAIMTVPSLSEGQVSPDMGDVTTEFQYAVSYSDPEGDAPVLAQVLIDAVAFDMSPMESEPDYQAGATFIYNTSLETGSHDYLFAFDDGHGPQVKTERNYGPEVGFAAFSFNMIPIDVGGSSVFIMGSPMDELGRSSDETQHEVTLTASYLIADIEVTQGLYSVIAGKNPSFFQMYAHPVESISWYDAVEFCNLLSSHEGLTPAYEINDRQYDAGGHLRLAVVTWDRGANGYRLPTEAEWEYACRAGTETALPTGDLTEVYCGLDAALNAIAWYCGNADEGAGPMPRDTGLKQLNAWNLYDVHGNVWEWCWDHYAAYSDGPVTDPTGPAGELWEPRTQRGGSWFYFARDCRSASRRGVYPNSPDNTAGFRVARNAD
jgi:formylglycine-generating enzyme required for sulfatase activity